MATIQGEGNSELKPAVLHLKIKIMLYCFLSGVTKYICWVSQVGTHGVRVIVIQNGTGKPSSNPRQGCLHFT